MRRKEKSSLNQKSSSVLGSVQCSGPVSSSTTAASSLPLRMLSGPRGHAPRSAGCSDIGVDVSPPSALGLVLVGAHELHPVDRDVLLLDGLLDAPLVLPEGLGTRVAAPVPLQELLGEPAVEALVVLPLQVGAGLPDTVHVRQRPENTTRRRSVEDFFSRSSVNMNPVTLLEPRDAIGWFESPSDVVASRRAQRSLVEMMHHSDSSPKNCRPELSFVFSAAEVKLMSKALAPPPTPTHTSIRNTLRPLWKI